MARLLARVSSFALSVLVVFMMSAPVECQMDAVANGTSQLSSLLVGHLEHTIDNLNSFTSIVSLLGGIAGLG